MKNSIPVAGLAVLLSLSCQAHAQSPLPGKYSGYYVVKLVASEKPMGLSLDIATVDGDRVSGTASRMASGPRPPCNGDYPVQGRMKGNSLLLRAPEKGGPNGDCGMFLRLRVEEGRLVGTMNGVKAELTR